MIQITIKEIEEAFKEVETPTDLTLFVAEAHDDYDYDNDASHRLKDHKGEWQDLPEEHILACQNALPHLGPEGVQYYTPAFMSWVLNNYKSSNREWVIDGTIYHLGTVSQNLKKHKEHQFSLFTENQIKACVSFLKYFVKNDPEGKYVDTNHIKKALERRWYREYSFLNTN